MKWQTIDTAPRDGTAIFVSAYSDYYKSWNWGVGKWEDDGFVAADWRCWGVSRMGASGLNPPTHWMPLPPPPEAEA